MMTLIRRSAVTAALLWAASPAALATQPASGTLSPDQPVVLFDGGPYLLSNPTGLVGTICGPDSPAPGLETCDDFALTIDLPADYFDAHPRAVAVVSVGWFNPLTDMALIVTDSDGNLVKDVDSGGNPEVLSFPVQPGQNQYTVRVVPFTGHGDSVLGEVRLVDQDPGATLSGPTPTYAIHQAPDALGNGAGEPTLDINPKTGSILYIAGVETLKVDFDDSVSPAVAAWSDVSAPTTGITTLDPILTGDRDTGRIFASQLAGATSLFAFTDDDGATWTPGQGAGQPHGVDHQGVGAGPYPPGLEILARDPGYPNTLYYCSQELYTAFCARSDDGGLTFNNSVPIYTSKECGGIHGHPKVAPDGTVYVPNGHCGDRQAVIVSEDAGVTWAVRRVPLSTVESGSDPSVGIATDGTVYFGYQATDGQPRIAVSHDRGLSWEHDQDVGAALGIEHTVFPAVVAGDPDRAAFAFLGTTTEGAPGATDFPGEWHLYIATTYDGGKTWQTVNATPGAPVQRAGGICTGGIACGNNRNLLDFNDAIIDAQGRIVVAFADGCIGPCEIEGPNSFSDKATIARQVSGPRLLAEFDPAPGATPAATRLNLTRTEDGVYLDWQRPDHRGAAIDGYRLYRAAGDEPLALIAELPAKTRYIDTTATDTTQSYFYRLAAVNANGEGVASPVVEAAPGTIVAASRYNAAPDRAPRATFEVTVYEGRRVELDASNSFDPDGERISSYRFDFGDGSPSVTQSAPGISHRYTDDGVYLASVEVTDAYGKQTDSSSRMVDVSARSFADRIRGGGLGPALLLLLALGGLRGRRAARA